MNTVDTLVGELLGSLERLGSRSDGENSSSSGDDLSVLDRRAGVEDLDVCARDKWSMEYCKGTRMGLTTRESSNGDLDSLGVGTRVALGSNNDGDSVLILHLELDVVQSVLNAGLDTSLVLETHRRG